MCSGGGGAADQYAQEQRDAEQQRKGRISSGMTLINKNFKQFDDQFFDKQNQAYLNYAMPQLNQQYNGAYHNLGYALARQGINQSSEGNRRYGDLSGDYQLQRQGVVDHAREVTQNARRSIEDARSGVIADLYATADPAAANNASLSRSAYLSQQPAFSPIGTLFANALDGLNSYQFAQQNAQNYQDFKTAAGGGVPGLPQDSSRNVG